MVKEFLLVEDGRVGAFVEAGLQQGIGLVVLEHERDFQRDDRAALRVVRQLEAMRRAVELGETLARVRQPSPPSKNASKRRNITPLSSQLARAKTSMTGERLKRESIKLDERTTGCVYDESQQSGVL
ncbi:MAG: hypothetical protein LC754_12875 [Acidobacteria bacterium]|nr:hypothetical protein [Acidobacteriota bacterium]